MNRQGSKWIRRERRLALYVRDGMQCVYCNTSVTEALLTLDHVDPRSHGGDNANNNLVTACVSCNNKRGNRDISLWCADVAQYTNETWETVESRVQSSQSKSINIGLAKALLGSIKADTFQSVLVRIAHNLK
jgi:CRISPR/Cas system Type II protein with McrA/HNH and RuvC-like nuclease domain